MSPSSVAEKYFWDRNQLWQIKQNQVYAFKVKQEYTQQSAAEAERGRGWNAEENAANPIWAVEHGQLGWVRDKSYDNTGFANVQLLGKNGYGWIPRHCIDVGAVKNRPTTTYIPGFDDNVVLQHSQSALQRCILTLFTEMLKHIDTLCNAGATPEDIKALSQDTAYMNAILTGKVQKLKQLKMLTIVYRYAEGWNPIVVQQ
jgi:hypothetical protein